VPLIKQKLVDGFTALQNNPSASKLDAARRWAKVYHDYAQGAVAGLTTPSGLVKVTIESQLASVGFGQFFASLELAMISYWTPAVWAGPGFTGITTSAIGAAVQLGIAAGIIRNMEDKARAARELAAALHRYTTTIVVTTTNISTGITAIVKLA